MLMSATLALRFACLALVMTLCVSCKEESEAEKGKGTQQGIAANSQMSSTTPVNTSSPNNMEDGKATIIDVSFKGSRGDDIPAQLYLPAGEGASVKPGILLQYGLGASKETGLVVDVAKAFMNHGYVTLVMDVPGRGERVAPGGKITNISNVLDQDLFRWFIADYKVALDYMKTRVEVDKTRIAYVGASWGAITGIPFVARAKDIKVLVSVVGGGGFFGIVPNELDPANNIGSIAPRPVLLINATNDEVILKPFSDALHAKAGANAKKVWLNTNHTLSGYDMKDFATRVLKFLDQKLQ